MSNPSSSKAKLRPVVPKLVEVIDQTIYGDIWNRSELSKRDRSMITISALIGMRQTEQLQSHLEKALDNGVTVQEISEIITHLAFYAGFPAALSAAQIVQKWLYENGLVVSQEP